MRWPVRRRAASRAAGAAGSAQRGRTAGRADRGGAAAFQHALARGRLDRRRRGEGGASRALVYHYFGGKNELYIAALGSAAKQLSVLLEPPTEGRPLERLRISLKRYFDFVESHAAGYTALLRGGLADRSGEAGEIVDGIRRLLLDRILHSLDVDVPPPILRITLRCWMATVETAGLDWLENRDVSRPDLERLLVDQLVVIMQVSGRHDPGTGALFDRLAHEEMNH
ncbi:TetR/AcrR family transcriptional regulator [Actinomadura luteofluorescens]|uniref:TetR/AcrR family transcriptional regulator n=1 Tax=Actinomadura luteofluorescens TaxID=46163 RepID=UPI003629D536